MSGERPLHLVLMWHMHQPDYRRPGPDKAREFALPWTYLHGIKDYCDMAAHLERHPGVRCVVNLVPVLLDQLDDYADQFASRTPRDALLRWLLHPDPGMLPLAERRQLLEACFRNDHRNMLEPFPQYKHLHQLYRQVLEQGEGALAYLSGDFYSDLLTWYHLAWCGETERRRQPLLAKLFSQGSGFGLAERQALFDGMGSVIAGLLPRYRALAERGQVELSATPYAHPLAPLLLDLGCAREALPDTVLPAAPVYPGGRTRVLAHIDRARTTHAARFGSAPAGLWPAEGAVSTEFLRLLGDTGCRWTASSEAVLAHSLKRAGTDPGPKESWLYRPYRLGGKGPLMFFRDERLSDLIGFEYARWHGADASAHFIAELERIAAAAPADSEPVVSVILDGENAWETYPYNGYYFFDHLYELLARHPYIRTTTYSELLAGERRPATLDKLVAGSWVYGTLSTWIGNPDKNRAWDLLCAAKQSYDLLLAGGRLAEEDLRAAEAWLTSCESSDWFWWLGDYNPGDAVASFEQLFRANLAGLYRQLGLAPPPHLSEPIGAGTGAPELGGTMRRANA